MRACGVGISIFRWYEICTSKMIGQPVEDEVYE